MKIQLQDTGRKAGVVFFILLLIGIVYTIFPKSKLTSLITILTIVGILTFIALLYLLITRFFLKPKRFGLPPTTKDKIFNIQNYCKAEYTDPSAQNRCVTYFLRNKS